MAGVAGDVEYDEARRVWNGMVDRYPALIARGSNVDHVIGASPLPASTTCPSPYAAATTE